MPAHELVVTSNDVEASRALARQLGGIVYIDDRPDTGTLPFHALIRLPLVGRSGTGSADLAGISLGTYRVTPREIKGGSMSVVALHTMIRHPDLSHAQADAHWHLQHGPLALIHHPYMSQYIQLSVDECLSGPSYDGFALCGFSNLDDLKQRFFAGPPSVDVIRTDVGKFSDVRRSPRRLVARVIQA
jgi:hypothetical protein